MFAIMEKTRMLIFEGFQPEPPVHTSTYLCEFNQLEVLGVLLDELVSLEDQPATDCLVRVMVKVCAADYLCTRDMSMVCNACIQKLFIHKTSLKAVINKVVSLSSLFTFDCKQWV